MSNDKDRKISLTDDFQFNVIDWYDVDELEKTNDTDSSEIDDTDSDEIKNNYNLPKKYVIKMFGRTSDGKSVYLKVIDFPPHFYILLPETWSEDKLKQMIENLIWKLKKDNNSLCNSLLKYEVVQRKKFYGFYAGKKFNFLRLVFKNKSSMNKTSRYFENPIFIKNTPTKFEIYESNIDPYIRFMHIKNIRSCGWVSIDNKNLIANNEKTTCNISYIVKWSDVNPIDKNELAPFYICSFDIECTSEDGSFPQAYKPNDKIIQIGMTFTKYGFSEITKKIMISLNSCDPINEVEVHECDTEVDLLLKFQEMIQREDPDVLTGYNIFGFDEMYIMDRAKYLNVGSRFYHMSKLKDYKCKLILKDLSSSALGDNKLKYIDTIGRVQLDLMKVVQRDHKLNSYKLDSVAENFFKDKISKIELETGLGLEYYRISSNNIKILKKGNYIRFDKNGETLMNKYKIVEIDYESKYFIILDQNHNIDNSIMTCNKLFWGLVKDDIKPKDIFELFDKTSSDRKLIAEYCIQDCALVSHLMNKLDILINNLSMANVCYVPLHYIFFRGQGIKSLSLVAKYSRDENYLIPVMKKDPDSSNQANYEGAIVFDPVIGFHQSPIPVMDYNSLYPSSIISRNVSHETLVTSPEYDNLPNYIYYDVTYRNMDGTNISTTTCRYAKLIDKYIESEPKKSKFGVIPTILMKLLDERKATKKEMEKEKDYFKKSILDGKQNALKVTANSIYGQLGAPVSPIYFKHGAACTTAIGKEMLCLGRDFVEGKFVKILEELYGAIGNEEKFEEILRRNLKENERDENFEQFLRDYLIDLYSNYKINPKIIYGDTDSIFINVNFRDPITNIPIYDKKTLMYGINFGKCASKFLKTLLPYPHNMEYEKTFYPFALMAKKKYIGNKYVDDDISFKQTSMGVVLKRRDNANIVKKVIGKTVDIMMNENDIDKTVRFIKEAVNDLLKGRFEIHDFVTSKTLKGQYKGKKLTSDSTGEKGKDGTWKWDDVECAQAHVCLCQRMKQRDPGNAPELNDRIPFVAVEKQQKKGVKMLLGEMIEHPEYIKENSLKIDYLFYLTNQIMNPLIQFLELMMDSGEAKKIFNDYIITEQSRRRGLVPLTKTLKINASSSVDSVDTFDDTFDSFGLSNRSIKPLLSKKTEKQKKTEKSSVSIHMKKYEMNDVDIEEISSSDEFNFF